MTQIEIEAVLRIAFSQCAAAGMPLEMEQQDLVLRTVVELLLNDASKRADQNTSQNPLDSLSIQERQDLLQFIQDQTEQNRPWKIQLLNDWLENRSSGSVQFVRDQYGLRWLEQVGPNHIAQYQEKAVKLSVGDRIEVSNNLWEWTQDEGPCSREWFACTVVAIAETEEPSQGKALITCTIRFDNGMEYEIQGVYEWNRYNWRWLQS
jgi:hypothetical protein